MLLAPPFPGLALLRPVVFQIALRYARIMVIAGFAEDLYGVLVGGDGFVEAAYFLQREAEVVQRHAFAVAVAGFAVDGGGVLVGGDGFVEPAHFLQREAEVVQRLPSPWRSLVSR